MTSPAYPTLRTDRLNAFVRLRANGIDAPDHALVKEFIREYLGPEYATRAIIRTVAERLTGSDDALIGTVLELAHAGGSVLEPADVLGLMDAAPRLPCAPVLGREDHMRMLRGEVLAHYDRETTLRVLHSILATAAKATARRIDLTSHTEASLRYVLAHRDERSADRLVHQVQHAMPPALIEPIIELIPDLEGRDARDLVFAAALLTQPLISTRFTDDEVLGILTRSWDIEASSGHQAVMHALQNPTIAQRLPDASRRWLRNSLDSNDLLLRAAAIRALKAETNRATLRDNAVPVLRRALRRFHVAPLHAVLDVVAECGPTVLGPHGTHKLRARIDRWIRSDNTTMHIVAARAIENARIRVALGPVAVQRAVDGLQKSSAPGMKSRLLAIDHELHHPRAAAHPDTRRQIPPATLRGREQLVTAVATAIAPRDTECPLPPADAVHSWRDLDPDLDVHFDLPGAVGIIDGSLIQGEDMTPYTVHALHTPREVLDNAERFRNCTKTWLGRLNNGRIVLVAINDRQGTPVYNADWELTDGGWVLKDCLARFNDARVPDAIWTELRLLTDDLNAGWHRRQSAAPDPASR